MKVEMVVVKKQYRETRALEPYMIEKTFPVPDESWAKRLELMPNIRRLVPKSEDIPEQPRRPRGRPRKADRPAED